MPLGQVWCHRYARKIRCGVNKRRTGEQKIGECRRTMDKNEILFTNGRKKLHLKKCQIYIVQSILVSQ